MKGERKQSQSPQYPPAIVRIPLQHEGTQTVRCARAKYDHDSSGDHEARLVGVEQVHSIWGHEPSEVSVDMLSASSASVAVVYGLRASAVEGSASNIEYPWSRCRGVGTGL